ncbi:hypothetical protein BC941DRAFT_502487 [Chlamydoabsidia padenii]|nr:hypothetical protein BC941DRAFT_502487 [Chlamydoabsidia padenii]
MTISEKYDKEIEQGMAKLRLYADAKPEGDWQLTGEKNGVKLYAKKPEDPNEPMIYRGDYLYKGASHLRTVDMTTPSIFSSSRRVYDSRFEGSEIRLIRSRYSSISYGQSKAVWPITPRDFSTLTLRDVTDDVTYFGLFSVVDDEINPPVEGYIRGKMVCTGWKISRVSNGMMITFINQLDLCGSVPTAVAKSTLQQMPLCTYKLAQYHDKYGFPPSMSLVDGVSVQYLGEDFDHTSVTYNLKLDSTTEIQQTVAEVVCCDKMFSKGFEVVVKGQAWFETVPSNASHTVRISHVSGPVTIQIVGKKKNK